ncbi:hypothetical protein LguiA_013239 [Lonicera macranthoides]
MPHSVRDFLPRKNFPKGFTFGAATSAFQIEGAAHEDGRGYDMGKAIDHYHRYKEDVAMMKWMGLDAYGFSISWSRILPSRKSGGLNFEGVKFYKDLIKELIANEITPYVSLFYWDVPQALEDKYGGFRSSQIVDDFGDYADICFMIFGNDVRRWITINKPGSFSEGGYAFGNLAPGRGDDDPNSRNPEGDPTTEPYIVTHNLLLAHAKAVEIYRTRYRETQKGLIGIAIQSFYFQPASNSPEDKKAQERALDFVVNRFLDPLTVGHYPKVLEEKMKVRDIDHEFKQEGVGAVKGSIDFLGLDYYSASYVRYKPDHDSDDATYTTDHNFEFPEKLYLAKSWPRAVETVYPQGLKDILIYVKSKYKGPIYITENGFGEKHDSKLSRHEAHHDVQRFSYMHQHLSQIVEVTKESAPERVDVKGYFAWTLWDCFEWEKSWDRSSEVRYGLIHVDFENNLKRMPKFSAHWFKYILQKQPRKKRRQPGVIKHTGPRDVTTRAHPTSNVSTRSLQPQVMDRAVGMSISDEFSTRSASSLGSNAFERTNSSNLSRRQLESEYEEDEEDEEDEDEEDESYLEELEASDVDSDPAHGSLDEEEEEEEEEDDDDDEDSDVNSAPIRPVGRRRF